jgi:lipoyl(octanoyl) transferase
MGETASAATADIEWARSGGLVPYLPAVAAMEARAEAIARGEAAELVWLLEHPPLYTAGTSAAPGELVAPGRFPVFETGRGGRYTYHGPGQRVAYVMLDVRRRAGDVRAFVTLIERWLIAALARLGVTGETRPDRVGVWVARPDRGPGVEAKIAAIGLRIRRGVSFHGLALNVAPDLGHFAGIVPCGIAEHGVTSLADLGLALDMEEVDRALLQAFVETVGPVSTAAPPAGAASCGVDAATSVR